MDITLAMLLDLALPDNAVQNEPGFSAQDYALASAPNNHVPKPEGSPSIRGIRIWSGAKETASEKSRDLLFLKKQKNGVLLSCGDLKMQIETDLSFAEIFNKFEETFIRLRDWDMQLHQGIIEDKGLQYMLDVSEDIIRRTMAITDSGYKMVAHLKYEQDEDSIFRKAIEKGYLPPEAIGQLDEAGFIFEKKAIIFRKGIEGLSHPMLNGTIYVEQDYRYMLVMLMPRGSYTEGIYKLFAFLLDQLTLYVETNGESHRIRRFAWMSLLSDLADGKCDQAEFTERNRYSDLPEGRPYHLISARRADGSMREFMKERLERVLAPDGIVFIHGESVFALLPDTKTPLGNRIAKIAALAAENRLYVCVSERFDQLLDLHPAYGQCQKIYAIGRRIASYKTLKELDIAAKEYDENIFLYTDYYPYALIAEPPCLAAGFLALLREDKRTDAGNLRLIYAYLKNDCSKTSTASELFMHRNNIIYRIDKIEERLGISFSDERVKTAFRLSFLALELLDPKELADRPKNRS